MIFSTVWESMDSNHDNDKCYCRVSYHRNISIQQKCTVNQFKGQKLHSKFNPKSLCEGMKLKFIPVYNPATCAPAQSKSMPSSSLLLYDFTEKVERDITKGMILHMILVTITGKSDKGAMKDCMSSESVIIEDSNLQKGAMASKDISRVDSTKMDSSREEPVQLKHETALLKVLSSEELAVVKVATKLPKTSARILTSSENMKILEEKEKKNKKLRRKGNVIIRL